MKTMTMVSIACGKDNQDVSSGEKDCLPPKYLCDEHYEQYTAQKAKAVVKKQPRAENRFTCLPIDFRSLVLGMAYMNMIAELPNAYIMTSKLLIHSAVMAERKGDDVEVVILSLTVIIFGYMIILTNLIAVLLLIAGLHKNKDGLIHAFTVFAALSILVNIVLVPCKDMRNGAHQRNLAADMLTIVFSLVTLTMTRYYLKLYKPNRTIAATKAAKPPCPYVEPA